MTRLLILAAPLAFPDLSPVALRYSPPYGASPEDEPDPVVDAEAVWALQADARDALAALRAHEGEKGEGV